MRTPAFLHPFGTVGPARGGRICTLTLLPGLSHEPLSLWYFWSLSPFNFPLPPSSVRSSLFHSCPLRVSWVPVTVLVCSGCHGEAPPAGRLPQHGLFLVSQFWRPESEIAALIWLVLSEAVGQGLLLACSWLSSCCVSSHPSPLCLSLCPNVPF